MELNDNKSENYILEQIFFDKEIMDKIIKIYNLIEQKEKIDLGENENFISNFYKNIGFINETFIGSSEKQEILYLFFGENFKSISDLEHKIKYYSKNILFFRELNIEKKGFIFHFLEIIIEQKININDEYYSLLKETKSDKLELIILSKELIINGLDIFYEEINLLLNSYKDFFDKYLSFDNNYLSTNELEWFKSHFLELFNNLFTYIISNNMVIEKIYEIEKRIKNKIILD